MSGTGRKHRGKIQPGVSDPGLIQSIGRKTVVESHGDLLGVAVIGLAESRQVGTKKRQSESIGKVLDRRRTPEDVVLIEGMVDPENVLVLRNIFDRIEYERVGSEVGRWNKLQQALRNAAEVGGRNHPSWKQCAIGSPCGLRHARAVLQRDRRNIGAKRTRS